MGIDLDELGISIIPIYGVHFSSYVKLFSDQQLAKKCVIIADGDQKPSDSTDVLIDDVLTELPSLETLKSKYVNVFYCSTTFELALTMKGTLLLLQKTAEECGALKLTKAIKKAITELKSKQVAKVENETLNEVASLVLNTAKRIGKARFAQIASKYVEFAEEIPRYIFDAVNWLIAK
jgi:putative ATP-dependent endonuclease of OLD family